MRSLVMLVALCGCVGHAPPPKLEDAGLPAAWDGAPMTTAERVEAAWWTAFHDPVLDALVATAERQNLDVRIAAARVREARALRGGARAELFPQLAASAELAAGRQRAGGDVTTSGQLAAEVSWEVDVFGRLRGAARAAAAELAASAADRDAVRVSTVAEVARSYIELRLFQQQREIAEKNAAAQDQTLRIARSRFEQGLTSRLDVARSEAIRAATRSQVAQAEELAESARHRLVLLLATTPEELSRTLPAAGAIPQADAVGVLLTPRQVIAQRPDVRAAERRLLAAAARREAAVALQWPRLTLAGLIGVGADDLAAGGASLVWSAGAGLLAPIFDFGRIRAQIDAADARQEQAYLAYERSARAALSEVQTATVLYARGLLAQQELTVAVEASRRAADIARRQYAVGALSLLEVLDADRTVYQDELAWARATAEVSLRAVRVHQTMGVIPR
jgi:NodT family efflux transporter outer membrane factor (OMF) lipoprotein